MATDLVIDAQGVSKVFRLYETPFDRLREKLTGQIRHREHVALRDVGFSLRRGETLGLLGCNGAGKSTLLKLIVGVLRADAGRLVTHGRVTGLLELGTGFDAALTGRQNIYINGTLLGLSHEELRSKEAQIVEFAELGDYIDDPLRTYSSGMAMRLGFSIAIHAEPACFVVDEALAVGDARFQQKCLERIRRFTDAGGSLLFVSHDLNAIRMVCSRAMVLHAGRILFDGDADAAGRAYYRILGGQTDAGAGLADGDWGSKRVVLKRVAFVDEHGAPLQSVTAGSTVRLRVDIEAHISRELTVGFMIRDRMGQEMFGTNSAMLGQSISVSAGQHYSVCFSFPMHLGPAGYTVGASLHGGMSHADDCEHWMDAAALIQVNGYPGYPSVGPVWQPVLDFSCKSIQPVEDSSE